MFLLYLLGAFAAASVINYPSTSTRRTVILDTSASRLVTLSN